MEQTIKPTGVKAISQFLNNPQVLDKFFNILGEKAQGFISAVLTIVNQSENLKNANPESIYTAALLAASLDLPINPNFGFAYIVPYFNGKTKIQEAQFQIGYKGLKQLAIRSGQFKTIIAKEVFEGQLIDDNSSILGYRFDWSSKTSTKVIGYVSYFQLLSGYESTFYMPYESVQKHASKYSQTFKKGYGLWSEDFDKMALKTVSKLHLNSGEAPLSIEMQKVVIADQAVIKNNETMDVEYIDNTPLSIEDTNANSERKSLIDFINKALDTDQLEELQAHIDLSDDHLVMLFETKRKEVIELESAK